MEKILLAVDGSEQSEKAAEKAGELAVALGAEVVILTVVDAIDLKLSPEHAFSQIELEKLMEQRKKDVKEKGEKILNKIETILKSYQNEKDIKIDKLLSSGRPAEYICEASEKNDYDLIILADKGEGRVKRFLLGSTSDRVVRHANTSVMIVK
jgi:nucleotide-binding universal stress UspA family protein